MKRNAKKWKFWAKYILETIWTVVLASVVIFILFNSGGMQYQGVSDWLATLHVVFPLYLILIGGFLLTLVVMNYFQIYMPMFISMSNTRREVLGSILAANVLTALLLALAAAALLATSQELPVSAFGNVFLLGAGWLLGLSGISAALGVATKRWGKLGTLFVILFFMGIGAGVGAGMAMFGNVVRNGLQMLHGFAEVLRYGLIAFGVGAGLYVLSAVFAVLALRRMEVKL